MESAVLGFVPFAGTDARLRWETEDGETGDEVSKIPTTGMVYFYDADGPVHRQENIDQARWWVFGKGNTKRLRITRLESDGRFTYLIPGCSAISCLDHNCPEPGQCAEVAAIALGMVREK